MRRERKLGDFIISGARCIQGCGCSVCLEANFAVLFGRRERASASRTWGYWKVARAHAALAPRRGLLMSWRIDGVICRTVAGSLCVFRHLSEVCFGALDFWRPWDWLLFLGSW